MAAANTDKFMKVGKSTATTLSSPGYTVGNTSVNVASTTNWPTDTGVMFAIDETDADGARVSGTYNVFRGTVASGTQIDNLVYVGGDTNRNYSAGATTRVYILVSADRDNRLVDGILVEHNQDGTHGAITATSVTTDSLTITGSSDAEGWSALGNTLTYSSNDGNKQATYTITGVDKTGTIQEGMKVKLPRPTAVGTQCTDLEASSSQYASKTSPSGITFTDDFTVGGWINMESYPGTGLTYGLISRYNGTTGFISGVRANGTIWIYGTNGTTRIFDTYQSVPLSKWVHVVATLNMSAGSSTIYINGVSVGVASTGSTGTALTQAGNLQVGAYNGGNFFDGKIKHAFVADKVLSAAEVKEAMVSDDLTSASFSANLDAYFKLEGDFTDSSANGNDLTASGGAVATDADSPFSSTEYGIVTSASFSTDTTVTVFTGDGVAPGENITAPAYSTHRTPYGFPASRDKWKISYKDVQDVSTTSTSYASLTSKINIPTGLWQVKLNTAVRHRTQSGSALRYSTLTLSTDGSTETHSETNVMLGNYLNVTLTDIRSYSSLSSEATVEMASSGTMTLLGKVNSTSCSLSTQGSITPTVIEAYCNYL